MLIFNFNISALAKLPYEVICYFNSFFYLQASVFWRLCKESLFGIIVFWECTNCDGCVKNSCPFCIIVGADTWFSGVLLTYRELQFLEGLSSVQPRYSEFFISHRCSRRETLKPPQLFAALNLHEEMKSLEGRCRFDDRKCIPPEFPASEYSYVAFGDRYYQWIVEKCSSLRCYVWL